MLKMFTMNYMNFYEFHNIKFFLSFMKFLSGGRAVTNNNVMNLYDFQKS